MRQITKQPALPEKRVYMEKKVFGYKSIAEYFNYYFASVFVLYDSEVVFPFNQSLEIFLGDIQLNKAALNEEIKYIRSSANSFDGIIPKFLKSALPYISNQFCLSSVAVLANVSFPFCGKKCMYDPISKVVAN